jgi:mycothiol synthase
MNGRPATSGDFEAIVDVLVTDEAHLTGRPSRIALADLRGWLAAVDLATNTWLFEEERRLVALGWVEAHASGLGFAVGVVHPDAKARGLGVRLVDTSEGRLRASGSLRVHQIALADDRAAAMLFTGRGYLEVRRFFEMGIEFETAPPAPTLPGGYTIEIFREEDARAFHDALDESFQDHWEHHSREFEDWWEQRSNAPDFDPTLWFLVRDRDEVVAVARNEPNRNGGGLVCALGVRRPWRGRGFGRALLLHTFGEFHRRGVHRISLGVDSENPTGATKLYESVGMATELEQVVYERPLL